MAWRNAEALLKLRAEFDAAFPNRDRASDGGRGDAAHSGRTSDHNPWVIDADGVGVVRAFDFDAGVGLYPSESEDVPGDTLFTAVLAAAKAKHPAMTSGSYIIYERGLYSHANGWEREPYRGVNPHESHVHVSVGRARAAYDSKASWGISGGNATGNLVSQPLVDASNIFPGANNAQVALVQRALNKVMGSSLTADGDYGANTTAVAKAYQTQLYGSGVGVDGDLGLESLTKLGTASGLFRAVA